MEPGRKYLKRNAEVRAELDGRNGIWSIEQWCRQFGISDPTFYSLDPKPHSVRVGARLRRITESPAAYSERLRATTEQAA